MQGRVMLLVTVLTAVVVTVGASTALLVLDPAAPRGAAIRTGAIGGVVVALYALWLDDRRRRTEQARHEPEGDKVADERFARSVELLGDQAEQVRVGALSLVHLATSTPRHEQTVLDIPCAYLRRSFDHPELRDPPAPPEAPPDPAADREREVRLTAQRLTADLLPWGTDPDSHSYHLDLSGARLGQFRLADRRVGRLIARRAGFHGNTRVDGDATGWAVIIEPT